MKLKVKSLLLTGLSGAGKSTLSTTLADFFKSVDLPAVILDGDLLRKGLNSDLNFSPEHRRENARRIAEVAKLFNHEGVISIIPIIAPYRADRWMMKEIIGEKDFFQIFVHCPLEVCKSRDTKGLYIKADLGIIENFTGISSAYEEPYDSDLRINTNELTVQESFRAIIKSITGY